MNPKQMRLFSKIISIAAILAMVIILFCAIFGSKAEAAEYKPYITCAERKERAHTIAEEARALGLPDSDPIIVRAQELWQAADTEFNTYAVMFAKVLYNEARGIPSQTEQACVIWTVLNRVDAGYGTLTQVLTASNQFAYNNSTPVWDNLLALSYDVLARWESEKEGTADVGRVLPSDYFWYSGNGKHNLFRNQYKSSCYWDYSLPSPYSN